MFERRGVNRIAMFDSNPEVIGKSFSGIPVYDVANLGEFCKREKVTIGVLTVPKEAAYEICRILIDSGIKGIWNFANMELRLQNEPVIVENIHLGDSLMKLCYEIKTSEENGGNGAKLK
jgi:redox-sensing transcriptional repressor